MASLTNPAILVNGSPVAYVPNSFEFSDGYGDRNIRTQTTGGGNVEQIITEDVETQIGRVKFTLISTTENIALVTGWQQNIDANAIELSADPNFTRQYAKMTITSEPAKPGGQDASFDVEFQGSKAI